MPKFSGHSGYDDILPLRADYLDRTPPAIHHPHPRHLAFNRALLSAPNIKWRDFQYTLPIIIQFWLYASPIVYPSSMISAQYRIFYGFNPMVGVIDGFRWVLLGTKSTEAMILVSIGVVVVLLVGGLFYFKRMDQYFAELV